MAKREEGDESVSKHQTQPGCAIVAGEICSESSDCLGSATAAGMVRDSVFNQGVLLS